MRRSKPGCNSSQPVSGMMEAVGVVVGKGVFTGTGVTVGILTVGVPVGVCIARAIGVGEGSDVKMGVTRVGIVLAPAIMPDAITGRNPSKNQVSRDDLRGVISQMELFSELRKLCFKLPGHSFPFGLG